MRAFSGRNRTNGFYFTISHCNEVTYHTGAVFLRTKCRWYAVELRMITNCSPAGKLIRRLCAGGALLLALLSAGTASGQSGSVSEGKAIFEWACASCHGPDARGANRSLVVFNTRLPDFTDCRFTAREPDTDWASIIQRRSGARIPQDHAVVCGGAHRGADRPGDRVFAQPVQPQLASR
jgi:hypothetical protein